MRSDDSRHGRLLQVKTPVIDVVFNERLVAITDDVDGKKVVIIGKVSFKGRQHIDWRAVEAGMKRFVEQRYTVLALGHQINIGSDFPDEYAGSRYTASLKGANAKAKANASLAIPESIKMATGGFFRPNEGEKHKKSAGKGWYRYDSRFAIPVHGDDGAVLRWNAFHTSLLVRRNMSGKLFLYDLIDIKKETSTPLELIDKL